MNSSHRKRSMVIQFASVLLTRLLISLSNRTLLLRLQARREVLLSLSTDMCQWSTCHPDIFTRYVDHRARRSNLNVLRMSDPFGGTREKRHWKDHQLRQNDGIPYRQTYFLSYALLMIDGELFCCCWYSTNWVCHKRMPRKWAMQWRRLPHDTIHSFLKAILSFSSRLLFYFPPPPLGFVRRALVCRRIVGRRTPVSINYIP